MKLIEWVVNVEYLEIHRDSRDRRFGRVPEKELPTEKRQVAPGRVGT